MSSGVIENQSNSASITGDVVLFPLSDTRPIFAFSRSAIDLVSDIVVKSTPSAEYAAWRFSPLLTNRT